MKTTFLSLLLLLGACAHLNVTDSADGRHRVTGSAASGGYTGSREEAIEQANDFCGRSRQRAVIESFDDKPEVGPKGEHTSELEFSCATPQALHFQ